MAPLLNLSGFLLVVLSGGLLVLLQILRLTRGDLGVFFRHLDPSDALLAPSELSDASLEAPVLHFSSMRTLLEFVWNLSGTDLEHFRAHSPPRY